MENNNIQPKNPEIDPLTNDEFVPDHEFDGIRELANRPPFWLTFLFLITVLFAYTYLINYHYFKRSPNQAQEYAIAMAEPEEEDESTEASADAGPAVAALDLTVPLTDASNLSTGETIYMTNCKVCHLAKGEGQTGPNLTDEYWIHGGSYEDIIKVVSNGVIEKGMIPWKNQISKKQIAQVSSYILTLQGTNPPNAKAPEGEKYKP